MQRVGLTGGIASGKTLVSDAFAMLGVPIVDADVIAREVVAPGSEGLNELCTLFGNDVLDETGALKRPALRQIIFNDADARTRVNALLHPLIRSLSERRIEEQADQGHPYLIHAMPLLVETGQTDRFDDIVVVDVSKTVQLERLMRRDRCTKEDAQRILDSQASRDERLAVATHVIDNSASVAKTQQRVMELHELFSAAV